MKLKRIVSLALAGVMAVSMLTACGNSNGNGGQVPPEENNTIDGGYSAMLAKYMEDVADLDHVTFQDNSDDVAALKDALGNFGNVVIGGGSLLPVLVCLESPNNIIPDFDISFDDDSIIGGLVGGITVPGVSGDGVLSINNLKEDFAKALDLATKDLESDDLAFKDSTEKMNVPQKEGTIFAIDGSISLEKVMNQIANGNNFNGLGSNGAERFTGLNTKMGGEDALPESGVDGQLTWHYNYTISASVVNVPATAVDGYNGSVNFIAENTSRASSTSIVRFSFSNRRNTASSHTCIDWISVPSRSNRYPFIASSPSCASQRTDPFPRARLPSAACFIVQSLDSG